MNNMWNRLRAGYRAFQSPIAQVNTRNQYESWWFKHGPKLNNSWLERFCEFHKIPPLQFISCFNKRESIHLSKTSKTFFSLQKTSTIDLRHLKDLWLEKLIFQWVLRNSNILNIWGFPYGSSISQLQIPRTLAKSLLQNSQGNGQVTVLFFVLRLQVTMREVTAEV